MRASPLIRCVVAVLMMAVAPASFAQSYPTKPIKLVAPSTPGDAPDVIARLVARQAVDRAGPAGRRREQARCGRRRGLGCGRQGGARRLHADHGQRRFARHQRRRVREAAVRHPARLRAGEPGRRGAERDGRSIRRCRRTPSPSSSRTPRAQPGKLSYASGGNGSSAHMSMELFKSMAGVDIQHIPYKGSSPALTDLVAGQVVVFIGNMPPTVPLVKAGKLRALAVTTKSRSALMPELPTIAGVGAARVRDRRVVRRARAGRDAAGDRQSAVGRDRQDRALARNAREAGGDGRRARRRHAGGIQAR